MNGSQPLPPHRLQYPGMAGCRRGCPQGFIVVLPKAVTNMDRLNLRLDLAQPARAVGAPFAVVPTPALGDEGAATAGGQPGGVRGVDVTRTQSRALRLSS